MFDIKRNTKVNVSVKSIVKRSKCKTVQDNYGDSKPTESQFKGMDIPEVIIPLTGL